MERRPFVRKVGGSAVDEGGGAMPTHTDTPTYTWEDLLSRIGEASEEERALYALNVPKSELAALGRRITSQKVLTDLLRWLGTAFACMRVTPAAVLGVPPELLRVVAYEGATLRTMLDRFLAEDTAQRVAQGASVAHTDGKMEFASKRREQLRAALAAAIHGDPIRRAELDAAYGSERDPKQLALALRTLTGLARTVLAEECSPAGERLARGGVTPELLTSLDELAAAVQAAGERSGGARARTDVSRADLDVQNGICLTHMRHLRDAFEAAHDLDPAVPRLVPIATRAFFSHGRHVPDSAEPAPAAGANAEPAPAGG
jgi:hypothetical protein